MSFYSLNSDTMRLVFKNITRVKDIVNFARACPRLAKLLYSSITTIDDKSSVPASWLLNLGNLSHITAPINCLLASELYFLAKSSLHYLHIVLNDCPAHKGLYFMDRLREFLDYEIQEKTLIFTNSLMKFHYEKGIVNIYKDNVQDLGIREIFIKVISLLASKIKGLRVFTKFISGNTQAIINQYIALFSSLSLTSLGMSFHVEEDVDFWMKYTKATRLYYIPIESVKHFTLPFVVWGKSGYVEFIYHINKTLLNMNPNINIRNLEIPISSEIMPLVLHNFPNAKNICIYVEAITRNSRINKLVHLSEQYPNHHFIAFIMRDPPEPKLPNIDYYILK